MVCGCCDELQGQGRVALVIQAVDKSLLKLRISHLDRVHEQVLHISNQARRIVGPRLAIPLAQGVPTLLNDTLDQIVLALAMLLYPLPQPERRHLRG